MRYKIYILALAIFLSLNIISATIEIGNQSHSIDGSYTKNSPLRGWINFSVTDEPGNTPITAFDSNITLLGLMDKNSIACQIVNPYECTCFPSDCEPSFSTFNTASLTKTYSLNDIETKLFGIKLDEKISEITNFRFNISTTAASSCINPLMIDIFDDGNIEFKTGNVSNDECLIEEPFGCFKLADKEGTTPIGSNPYCGKIIVPPVRGFNIGAKVIGDESASFTMTLSASGLEESCTISNVDSTGTVFCKVILETDLLETTTAEVCISATEDNEDKFSINFEDVDTCGFVDVNGDTTPHDFEIFAKPLKYLPPAKISFNDDLFDQETNISINVFDYIKRRYNADCEANGCIIPLRLYSGVDQSVSLSELFVDYNVEGLNREGSEETNFEDITGTPALFTSAFIKYDIEEANLLTPKDTDVDELELEIGDKKIIQNISIIQIATILNIIPTRVATLVPTRFFTIISEVGNLTYTWNFGDNSQPQTTQINVIEHTYPALGSYPLTVNITNDQGTNAKTVSINVVAPFQAINETIVEYRARLKNIDNNLFVLEDKIQERISQVIDTADLKSAINRIEGQYKELFESESNELVKLMKQLNELNVPKSFGISLEIKPSKFVQGVTRLDTAVIGEFGAGSVEQDKSERYYSAINQWIGENIDITIESKAYSFYFTDNTEQTALTHITLNLKPKRSISELFMIIEGDTNNIRLLGDYSEREIDPNHFGITFSELEPGDDRKIEFLYPGKTEALNPPTYLSPEFRFLELGFTPGVCNNDGICSGQEDYNNCRADCKPITRTIIFLVILAILAFIIYIALQEWYKRNYQKHLFKNKNALFNLVTFMSNGEHQGMSKDQIFKQLKPRKWNSEQLNYAWKKLHNKRTGMFEIPIFRFFEKKKLKKELAKRKAMGLA